MPPPDPSNAPADPSDPSNPQNEQDGQTSPDQPGKDRYEQLKEDLGYDDEDIRALAKSIKTSALTTLLGSKKERQVDYLIKERNERDKEKIQSFKAIILNSLKGHKKHGGFRREKEEKAFEALPRLIKSICGDDVDKWEGFAHLQSDSTLRFLRRLQALAEAKDAYGEDIEIFKVFVDLANKDDDLTLKALAAARGLYGSNKEKIREILDVIMSLKGKDENQEYPLIALAEAKDAYGSDEKKWQIFVDVGKTGGASALAELAEAQDAYGDDPEKFKVFVDLAKEKGGDHVKALAAAEGIYGSDINKFKEIRDIIFDININKDEDEIAHCGSSLFALANAKEVYGDNEEKFLALVEVTKMKHEGIGGRKYSVGAYGVSQLTAAREIYGDDDEKFRTFLEVAKENVYALEPLIKAKEIYGNDEAKFQIFVRVALEKVYDELDALLKAKDAYKGSEERFKAFVELVMAEYPRLRNIESLANAKDAYGEDPEKFRVFVEMAKEQRGYNGQFKISYLANAKDAYGKDPEKFRIFAQVAKNQGHYAVETLAAAKRIYGTDTGKLLEVRDIILEVYEKQREEAVKTLGYNSVCDACGTNIEMLRAFAQVAEEQGHELVNYLGQHSDIYGDDVKKLKLAADYFKLPYPKDIDIIKAFVQVASATGRAGNVDFNEVGRKYAESFMDGPDWYQKILKCNKYKEFNKFLPGDIQDFFGIVAQVNMTALSSKMDEHFKPFELGKGDMPQKMRILKIYGRFLEDFNGTLVPVIWHLYCLLSDQGNAPKYLTNIRDLNNLRELENLSTISDLHQKIYSLKEGILLGEVNLKKYQQSDLSRAVLDDMTKVSASDWKRENRSLKKIVAKYVKDEDEVMEKFNPNIYKSGFIPVREMTEPLERDPALTGNVTRVQNATKRFVGPGNELMDEKSVMELLKNEILQKIKDTREKSRRAVEAGVNAKGEKLNEKALAFAKKSLGQLDELTADIAKIETLESMIHILLGGKTGNIEFETEIRTIFYYLGAKRQNLAQGGTWLNADPSAVEASALSEFLNDTILLEVVQGKCGGGPDIKLSNQEQKAVKREFAGLLNFLKQKQSEEEEFKKNAETSKKNIAIVAGRGLLAELSGFYSDACWTQRADILKNNPTMVGHAFVENFEDKEKSRIIGGCLTLESSIQVADKETGRENTAKVLIVRGLNPQNAYINKYDVGNFVENFLDYVQETARKAGAEYVVLPLHMTGALSNRPQINNHLGKKYKDAERVSLNDNIGFNGYPIKESCVVVRVVKENIRKGKLPKPSNVPLEKQGQWIGSW